MKWKQIGEAALGILIFVLLFIWACLMTGGEVNR